MIETLLGAYTPLILWTGLGLLLCRVVPAQLPRLLGRGLYWVGVPLQILALVRLTDFSQAVWLPPLITVSVLAVGLAVAVLSLQVLKSVAPHWLAVQGYQVVLNEGTGTAPAGSLEAGLEAGAPASPADDAVWFSNRPREGSLILSSIFGNTGFVGLGLVPSLISEPYLGWVVLYSVAHNLLGSYGLGVFLASYFGRPQQEKHWLIQLGDVLSVPSLWSFALGWLSRDIPLPDLVNAGLQGSLWLVVPSAFVLTGMRLGQAQGFQSLQLALVPATLKVLVLPGLVGLSLSLLGLPPAACLAMVLMSGMPTAFASLILAEEYDLDRELTASSIALSTVGLLVVIPLWLFLFA